MNLASAIALLKTYSSLTLQHPESDLEKQNLQQAISLVSEESDYQNLGICADNSNLALASLGRYLKALGYPQPHSVNESDIHHSPVYVKYNTQKMTYYIEPYSGIYRGVLIACQSENENLASTFGHFPLDLYPE